jgi:hypothetical protein
MQKNAESNKKQTLKKITGIDPAKSLDITDVR